MARSPSTRAPQSSASAESAASAKSSNAPENSPPPVVIRSLEAADSVLAELSRLNAVEQRVQADCDNALAATREKFANLLNVEINGKWHPIADRRAQLVAQLQEFCEREREAILFFDDKKSRALNHGTIGWRASKTKLVSVDGGSSLGNATILEKICAHLYRALEKFELFSAGTARFLKLTVKWDQTALLKAVETREISAVDLKRSGFCVERGEDEFFYRLQERDISSLNVSSDGIQE